MEKKLRIVFNISPFISMHVISYKILREYFEKEPKSRSALVEWFSKTKKAEWKNFADMKKTLNSVDNVGNGRYVFNIKGNHYRMVVIIRFKKVLIRWVGNHK